MQRQNDPAAALLSRVALGGLALAVAVAACLWVLNETTQGPVFCWDNSGPFKVGQFINVKGDTVKIESMTYSQDPGYHACARHPGLLQR